MDVKILKVSINDIKGNGEKAYPMKYCQIWCFLLGNFTLYMGKNTQRMTVSAYIYVICDIYAS